MDDAPLLIERVERRHGWEEALRVRVVRDRGCGLVSQTSRLSIDHLARPYERIDSGGRGGYPDAEYGGRKGAASLHHVRFVNRHWYDRPRPGHAPGVARAASAAGNLLHEPGVAGWDVAGLEPTPQYAHPLDPGRRAGALLSPAGRLCVAGSRADGSTRLLGPLGRSVLGLVERMQEGCVRGRPASGEPPAGARP